MYDDFEEWLRSARCPDNIEEALDIDAQLAEFKRLHNIPDDPRGWINGTD